MTDPAPVAPPDPQYLLQRLREYRGRNDWEAVIAVGRKLPAELTERAWREVADAVAFGLGQKGRYREAIALLERVVAVEPSPRRLSSLAYLHYVGALSLTRRRRPAPERDRPPRRPESSRDPASRGGPSQATAPARSDNPGEPDEPAQAEPSPPTHASVASHRTPDSPRGDRPSPADIQREREYYRQGFRRWIAEALRARPDSIKDLYRLGLFEAQVESLHDKAALRAFLAAIRAYRATDEATRRARGDLRKVHAKCLYAAARSALRLGRHDLARRLSFECIRVDRDHDDVPPVFKLALAGRVCMATGELDHAERAFRLALDGNGPPERDWLHGYLARLYALRGDPASGARWLDEHVPARRRPSWLWRLRGDLGRDAGNLEEALRCYEAALERDRVGRHVTFLRIGEVNERLGKLRAAEHAYRNASQVRKRVHGSDEPAALAGLARVLEARGKRDEAQRMRGQLARLAKVRPHAQPAETPVPPDEAPDVPDAEVLG